MDELFATQGLLWNCCINLKPVYDSRVVIAVLNLLYDTDNSRNYYWRQAQIFDVITGITIVIFIAAYGIFVLLFYKLLLKYLRK
jgi:hypothetical protein